MQTRILPREEWPKLAATDFGPVLDRLNPDAVTIVVTEEDAEIVGCWGLITFAHVEGLWLTPRYRGRGRRIFTQLWNAMRTLALGRSIDVVYTGALSGDVKRLLEWRGAEPLPPMFALPLKPWRQE